MHAVSLREAAALLVAACAVLWACGGDDDPSHSDGGTADGSSDAGSSVTDGGDVDAVGTDASVPVDAGPPPCDSPGATRTAECGNCGLRSELCSDALAWEPASECLDEGECAPGAVERMALPMCAEQSRICDETCAWREWTMTMPPSDLCDPGETRVARGACMMDGVDYDFVQQTCSASCEWVSSGTCDDGCEYDPGRGNFLHPCMGDEDCVATGFICAPEGFCIHRNLRCSRLLDCPEGLVCRNDPDYVSPCERDDALVGDPCAVDDDCGAPLRCFDGYCTTTCDHRCARGFSCDVASGLCGRLPDA